MTSLIKPAAPAESLAESSAVSRVAACGAVICLVVVGVGALSGVGDVPVDHLVWPALITVIPAFVVTAFSAPRLGAVMMVLAVPATLLSAGFPLRALAPGSWSEIVLGLATGTLHTSGADSWSLAVPPAMASLMLAAGTASAVGAAVGASASGLACGGRTRRLVAFGLLAAPWLIGVCLKVPNHAAWEGAVVLVAGVLWFSDSRAALWLAVLVSVPAVALAHAVGPSIQWFGLAGHLSPGTPFAALDTEPTYGPLNDRLTGATMLIITAPAPAMWRMQALEYWDGRWIADSGGLPQLPEPGARRENVQIHVAGLREGVAVAPGRIDRISARGQVARIDGEAVVMAPTPPAGSTYRVQAEYVHPSAAELSRDRAPLDAAAREYTRVEATPAARNEMRRLGWMLGPLGALWPALTPTPPDPRVVALARRLASGAHTEWTIVARVQRYLVDSGRFRYTTTVPEPGRQPLVDFLLHTHAGYCQQFAGAAALLLRLAGVPARVVSGFATGTPIGASQYAVRDLDAHEWIEVYFEGYGWVPFNPTPAAAPALIAAGVDPLIRSAGPAEAPQELYLGAGLIAVAVALVLMRRHRRRSAGHSDEWLWRVVQRAGGEVVPSTTLADARRFLAARIGPCTADLADAMQRRRFAAEPPPDTRHGRIRVARALLADLGLRGATVFWVRSVRLRRRPQPVSDGQAQTAHMVSTAASSSLQT